MLAQGLHRVLAKHRIGTLQDQRKGVVAAPRRLEIGLVALGIQIFQEELEVRDMSGYRSEKERFKVSDAASRTMPCDRNMRAVSYRSRSFVETIPPAHVVGVVEGEVRHQTEGPKLLAVERGAVGLRDILDERDLPRLELIEKVLVQGVIAQDVGQEHRLGPQRDSVIT